MVEPPLWWSLQIPLRTRTFPSLCLSLSIPSGPRGWKRTMSPSFAVLERFPGYFPCCRRAQLSRHREPREGPIGACLGLTPRQRLQRLEQPQALRRVGRSSRPGLGGRRGAASPVRSIHGPVPARPEPPARPGSAARPPGTSGTGTQLGSAGVGPERGTGWTVGKMAAAVAGPRGRGAADADTDTDSGNGSGNGIGPLSSSGVSPAAAVGRFWP